MAISWIFLSHLNSSEFGFFEREGLRAAQLSGHTLVTSVI